MRQGGGGISHRQTLRKNSRPLRALFRTLSIGGVRVGHFVRPKTTRFSTRTIPRVMDQNHLFAARTIPQVIDQNRAQNRGCSSTRVRGLLVRFVKPSNCIRPMNPVFRVTELIALAVQPNQSPEPDVSVIKYRSVVVAVVMRRHVNGHHAASPRR